MMRRSKKEKMGNGGVLLQTGSIMRKFLSDFLSNESGAAAIEYALIVVSIALAIMSGVQAVGTALNLNFTTASTGVNP